MRSQPGPLWLIWQLHCRRLLQDRQFALSKTQTRYNNKEKKLEEEKRDLELEYKNIVGNLLLQNIN
jgi:hypothetical protein